MRIEIFFDGLETRYGVSKTNEQKGGKKEKETQKNPVKISI